MIRDMDSVMFLEALKVFTEEAEKGLLMPTKVQAKGEEQQYREPLVYKMRLPDSKSATKKAPYILHQLVTITDEQQERNDDETTAVVRSIFCCYSLDEQEGALMLLNMYERFRAKLLKECVIDSRFELDKQAKLEFLAYPDDTAPFFAGEAISVWKIPAIKREVTKTLWGR